MTEVHLPSRRTSLTKSTGCGIKAGKPHIGMTAKNKKDAYQTGIYMQKDLLYLSRGTMLSESAPFSIPIRNAALNLNSDFEVLKFTPRSGALPRIVDAESGYEFLPARKQHNKDFSQVKKPYEKDFGYKQGKNGDDGGDEEDDGDDDDDDGGDDGGGDEGLKQEDFKQESSLVPPTFHSKNPNISDGEYLAALASEDTYQNPSQRGQNQGLVEAGYSYENDMSTDEVAVYSNGSDMVVSLRGSQGFNDYVEDLGVVTAGVTRTSRYQSDLSTVQDLVERYKAAGLKGRIIVSGHSLGGATAAAVTQRLIEDDPSLQSTLYGVTFNRLTGPLTGCRGSACDNITNLNAEGDVANTLDPDTTRVVKPQCKNKLRHSIGQFTQSNCSSQGTSKSVVLRGGEKLIGGVLDTAKDAVKSVARTVASVGGVLGGAAGGYVSGGNPIAAKVGSAAGNFVGDKTVGAVGGLFRGSGQTGVTLEERISGRRNSDPGLGGADNGNNKPTRRRSTGNVRRGLGGSGNAAGTTSESRVTQTGRRGSTGYVDTNQFSSTRRGSTGGVPGGLGVSGSTAGTSKGNRVSKTGRRGSTGTVALDTNNSQSMRRGSTGSVQTEPSFGGNANFTPEHTYQGAPPERPLPRRGSRVRNRPDMYRPEDYGRYGVHRQTPYSVTRMNHTLRDSARLEQQQRQRDLRIALSNEPLPVLARGRRRIGYTPPRTSSFFNVYNNFTGPQPLAQTPTSVVTRGTLNQAGPSAPRRSERIAQRATREPPLRRSKRIANLKKYGKK